MAVTELLRSRDSKSEISPKKSPFSRSLTPAFIFRRSPTSTSMVTRNKPSWIRKNDFPKWPFWTMTSLAWNWRCFQAMPSGKLGSLIIFSIELNKITSLLVNCPGLKSGACFSGEAKCLCRNYRLWASLWIPMLLLPEFFIIRILQYAVSYAKTFQVITHL